MKKTILEAQNIDFHTDNVFIVSTFVIKLTISGLAKVFKEFFILPIYFFILRLYLVLGHATEDTNYQSSCVHYEKTLPRLVMAFWPNC